MGICGSKMAAEVEPKTPKRLADLPLDVISHVMLPMMGSSDMAVFVQSCKTATASLNRKPASLVTVAYNEYLEEHNALMANKLAGRGELAAHSLKGEAIRRGLSESIAPSNRLPRYDVGVVSGMIKHFQRAIDTRLAASGVPSRLLKFGEDGFDIPVPPNSAA